MATFSKKIVRLKFTGPLHIGTGRSDNYEHSDELIRSDTIKSALYVLYRQVYPELAQQNDGLDFFTSFTISSAFPFYEDELFLPKPVSGFAMEFPDLSENEKSKLSKRSKKIQFVGLKVFGKFISGTPVILNEKHLDSSKRFLFSQPQSEESKLKILTREMQQRVYIPHSGEQNQNSQPYFIERLFFAKDAGLYFLMEVKDDELLNRLTVCIKILGDMGFGTDKNVGNGQFEATVEDFKMEVPENATHQLALGLFCPEKEAINFANLTASTFATIKRGGFLVSAQDENFRHFRKKSVYMFTEGSTFPAAMPNQGKVVNLKPETVETMHPVWRDGTCLFLPIKL